ncbi:hypothetical protein LY76DRAFT_337539 [Colletotrichum caudatum]|nr:hypothetical protein LY76DRAFT_337539 [Colletotrichum caudatum]
MHGGGGQDGRRSGQVAASRASRCYENECTDGNYGNHAHDANRKNSPTGTAEVEPPMSWQLGPNRPGYLIKRECLSGAPGINTDTVLGMDHVPMMATDSVGTYRRAVIGTYLPLSRLSVCRPPFSQLFLGSTRRGRGCVFLRCRRKRPKASVREGNAKDKQLPRNSASPALRRPHVGDWRPRMRRW